MRWFVVGALVIAAQVLLADPSQAFHIQWRTNCEGTLPSCFSFEVSRDGNTITLINDCDEEYGVVPVIVGGFPHWPVTAVRPGTRRTRSHPPWWDSYTGVKCCEYLETVDRPTRGGGRCVNE